MRHNIVSDTLQNAAENKGWTTTAEPTIPTTAGIRRPDVVIWKGDQALVIDTTISADANACVLEDVYKRKRLLQQ